MAKRNKIHYLAPSQMVMCTVFIYLSASVFEPIRNLKCKMCNTFSVINWTKRTCFYHHKTFNKCQCCSFFRPAENTRDTVSIYWTGYYLVLEIQTWLHNCIYNIYTWYNMVPFKSKLPTKQKTEYESFIISKIRSE